VSTIVRRISELIDLAAHTLPADTDLALRRIVHVLTSSDGEPRDPALRDLLEQLALRLFSGAPVETRHRFAEYLGGIVNAPRRLSARVAADAIEVARHALASPALTRVQIQSLIDATTTDHRRVIAGRSDLDAGLSAALIAHREEPVLNALAANHAARLSPDSFFDLIRLSADFRSLQVALLQRPDLSATALKMLHDVVSAQLKEYIERRFGRRLREELRKDAAIAMVEDLADQGRLRPSFLMRALHQRNTDLVAATLSHFSALPFALMRAAVRQAAAGPLARLCRAMGIGAPGFETILVLNRRLQGLSLTLDDDEAREVDLVFPRRTRRFSTASYAA